MRVAHLSREKERLWHISAIQEPAFYYNVHELRRMVGIENLQQSLCMHRKVGSLGKKKRKKEWTFCIEILFQLHFLSCIPHAVLKLIQKVSFFISECKISQMRYAQKCFRNFSCQTAQIRCCVLTNFCYFKIGMVLVNEVIAFVYRRKLLS